MRYEVHMFQKTTAIAAWACLAFIVFATISPIQFRPSLPTSPTFEHLAAFAVFAVLLTFAYPRSTAMVCLVVVGSAILLEAIQMLTPDRDARALDAIQKIAGGMLGIIVVNVTRSRRGRSRTAILRSKNKARTRLWWRWVRRAGRRGRTV
jgi:glycopeptide antibiotics resistance protein